MAKVWKVASQQEFDVLVDRINCGEESCAYLAPGEYILKKSVVAKAPLTIKGKNARITGKYIVYEVNDTAYSTCDYYVYKQKQKISEFPLFVDKAGQPIMMSESVDSESRVNRINVPVLGEYQAMSGVEAKIPIAENLHHLAGKTFHNAFGYFDCGWARVDFAVERADAEYFYCKTLDYANVQKYDYDLSFYKRDIRYVLYNAEKDGQGISYDNDYLYVPKKYNSIRYLTDFNRCKESATIKCYSSTRIEGVSFGNVTINIVSKERDECVVRNCSFENTLDKTLTITKHNVGKVNESVVEGCSFFRCALLEGSVVSLKSSCNHNNGIIFRNNVIARYPDGNVMYKNWKNSLSADGDITISNNVIYNSCRDHMYLSKGNIICRNNLLYNDKRFNHNVLRNQSCDFGLVYCGNVFYSTPEKVIPNTDSRIEIYGNVIYGAYAYGGDARGVFIDDGRCDVTCSGNVIFDTQYFSIDSREASNFKGYSSVRNRITGNVLMDRYRLEVSEGVADEDKSIASNNYLVGEVRPCIVKNIVAAIPDTEIEKPSKDNRYKIKLTKNQYKTIKGTSYWDDLKCFVRK